MTSEPDEVERARKLYEELFGERRNRYVAYERMTEYPTIWVTYYADDATRVDRHPLPPFED